VTTSNEERDALTPNTSVDVAPVVPNVHPRILVRIRCESAHNREPLPVLGPARALLVRLPLRPCPCGKLKIRVYAAIRVMVGRSLPVARPDLRRFACRSLGIIRDPRLAQGDMTLGPSLNLCGSTLRSRGAYNGRCQELPWAPARHCSGPKYGRSARACLNPD
jgi:hypothetical protein